jgi:prepilin-type N-terminal cleavage/methylation domain-containing protein
MRSTRSIRRSRAERRAGFSLIELLVTIGVSGITLASVVHFYSIHARQMRQHSYRLESQQAMRSSLDAITRDLRLAGACLPLDGQFISLAGANLAGGDTITIRTGLVRTNMSCIGASTTADAALGATSVQVDSVSGFTADMLIYLRAASGAGEISAITAVGASTISFQNATQQAYLAGSGVYAIDERAYALDQSDPDVPVLTLTVNRAPAQAFAAGVSDLQVRYVLNENCPTCTTVDLPVGAAQWQLLNSVVLTATVRTVGGVRPEDAATIVATSTAKPRNLLPP